MRIIALLCGCLLLGIVEHSAQAATAIEEIRPPKGALAPTTFDYDQALSISQQAIGNLISDYHLLNAAGKPVRFSRFLGKPLVLSMIYTSCYQICPMTSRYLSKIVEKARKTLGEDSFAVAVIGFDTAFDTPSAMRYFAKKQGIDNSNWNLLSISATDIGPLSREIGFQYFPSSNGFDHLIQATIIDADGKVYRQVYGQVFDTPLLIDPLIELVLGQAAPEQSLLADIGSKIKLFCTSYDPVRDGYYFDYSLFLGMLIGGSIIVLTTIVVIRGLRKN